MRRAVGFLVVLLLLLLSLPPAQSAEWCFSGFKRCFSTGSAHSAIDVNYTFNTGPQNTTQWSDTNLLGYSILDESTCTELDMNYRGTSSDTNFLWKANHSTLANVNDQNYCVYYGQNARTTIRPMDLNKVYMMYDGFETGNYTPMWGALGTGGTIAMETSVVVNGGYSVKITTDGDAGGDYKRIHRGLGPVAADVNTVFEGWMRKSSTMSSASTGVIAMSNTSTVDSTVSIRMESGNWIAYSNAGAGTTMVAFTANTWYRWIMEVDSSAGKASFWVYNQAGALIGSAAGVTASTTPIAAYDFWTLDNGASAYTIYLDNAQAWHKLDNEVEMSAGTESGTSGLLRVIVSDENSMSRLASASVTLDGNTFTTNSNGSVDINMWYLPKAEYTITLSKTNYTTRYFAYDLNGQDSNTLFLALLPTTKGQSIPFKFYDTDETTVLGSAMVEVRRVLDLNAYSRVRTNASGELTFFLRPEDGNYFFRITKASGAQMDYNTVIVTVQPPKNEGTGAQIIPVLFNITVSGISDQLYTGQAAAKSFYAFPNTISNYITVIDVNSEFYDRKYYFNFKGDPKTYSLQPYLVSSTAGTGTSTKIITQNSIDGTRIGNVQVYIYKYVAGSGTTIMETVTTDDKGEGFVSGLVNDTYTFKVYYGGVLIKTASIAVTSSEVIIAFNPTPPTPPSPFSAIISINFRPPGGKLINDVNLYQDMNVLNGTFSLIRIFVTQIDENNHMNDVNLYDANWTSGFTYPFTNVISLVTDINSEIWDANYNINVTIMVRLTNGLELTQSTTYAAYVGTRVSDYALNFIKGAGFRNMLGCSENGICGTTIFIAVLLTVFACGAVVMSTPIRSPSGIGVFAAMILGFFTYLNWVPIFWFVLFCFLVFISLVGIWKVTA